MNPILRNPIDLDWMTLVLVLSLVLLSVGKYFYTSAFYNFIILPFNNKYITLNKKKGKLLRGFHIIISVFQMINTALFFFIALKLFLGQPLTSHSEHYLIIVGVVLLFFVVKMLLQIGNGYFFNNSDLMIELIFEKFSYFNYWGLVAFVGNILCIYVLPQSVTLVFILFLLLLAIFGIGTVKTLRNHQKLIVRHTFYFILYLCTLEISPIAIIFSYLNSSTV